VSMRLLSVRSLMRCSKCGSDVVSVLNVGNYEFVGGVAFSVPLSSNCDRCFLRDGVKKSKAKKGKR
jgi:hypothetical protein